MSDATPTSTKKVSKGWTDNEKLGLLFQIIEKAGNIPWAQIDLPEGRTAKACSVMVDKEKAKLRKAKEVAASGEGEGEESTMATPATPDTGGGKNKVRIKTSPFNLEKEIGKLADSLLSKKRSAMEDDATTAAPSASSAKKQRVARKSKKIIRAEEDAAAAAVAEAGEEVDDEDDEVVKAEIFE